MTVPCSVINLLSLASKTKRSCVDRLKSGTYRGRVGSGALIWSRRTPTLEPRELIRWIPVKIATSWGLPLEWRGMTGIWANIPYEVMLNVGRFAESVFNY